jgi:hypothetical protein
MLTEEELREIEKHVPAERVVYGDLSLRARTDIPKLIAEIRRLKESEQSMVDQAATYRNLAIRKGATAEDFEEAVDKDLAEAHTIERQAEQIARLQERLNQSS